MKRWQVLVVLALILPSVVVAGPNGGGVLVLHRNPAIIYTSTQTSYCGQSNLASCANSITRAPASPDSIAVFHVLAAFPADSMPRLKAVAFGIEYDPERLTIVRQGACSAFELADNNWPDSGSGTAIVLDSVSASTLTELYWFAAFASTPGDTTLFSLGPHPMQGGQFADDAIPAVLDSITAYGRLGFGVTGYAPCPDSGEPGGPDGPDYPVEEGDTRFVWALHLGESVAQVPVNRFTDPTYRKSFPLSVIPVKRSEWIESVPVHFQVLATEVPVRSDGTLEDSVLVFPLPDSPGKSSGAARRVSPETLTGLQDLQIDPSTVIASDSSPDGGMTVVRTRQTTIVLSRGSGGNPVVHQFPITGLVFSPTGSCAATATKDGRLIVFDRTGAIVFETPSRPRTFFEELRLDADCSVLTYVEESSGRRVSGVANLRSRLTKALADVAAGVRYYSADGTRMLVVTGHVPGAATYYDTSNPEAPVALAEYATARPIVTAAVCDDGSLVAIEEDEGTGRHFRATLLDGSLQPVGDPLVTECSIQGLQFEGKFLFLGIQRHPYPAPVQSIATTDVLLFDLSY